MKTKLIYINLINDMDENDQEINYDLNNLKIKGNRNIIDDIKEIDNIK